MMFSTQHTEHAWGPSVNEGWEVCGWADCEAKRLAPKVELILAPELKPFTPEPVVKVNGNGNGHKPQPVTPDKPGEGMAERIQRRAWTDRWEQAEYMDKGVGISTIPDGTRFTLTYIGNPRAHKYGSHNANSWTIGLINENGEPYKTTLREGHSDRDASLREMQGVLGPKTVLTVTKETVPPGMKNGRVWLIPDPEGTKETDQ